MPYKSSLPHITDKQMEILGLVFKFRFMNRYQIQSLLGHKDPRRVNGQLKDLVEKSYLGRIYSHKLLENTKPAKYFLANNGITWARWNKGGNGNELETKQVKKFYSDKRASEIFINHCIIICELYVQLKDCEKKLPWTYDFSTKTELWIQHQMDEDFKDIKDYLPDVHITKLPKAKDNETFQTFFLELFDAHAPSYFLRYKVNQYISLRGKEDLWDIYSGSKLEYPTVLFILPDSQKLSRLAKYIREQLDKSGDEEDLVFQLTTIQKVNKEGIGNSDIWKSIT